MAGQLRIPGPTPCPPEVLEAMAKQMVNHRGQEFKAIMADVTAKLKTIFQTKNDVIMLTGSGTGGLEAAVVNTLSPADKVLGVTIGVFGDRFITIAKSYGADVTSLKYEMGKAADPAAIADALKKDPAIKAVLVTHNETSTGVTNDLAAIAKVVKDAGKLLLVDAVSSLSSIDVQVDNWNLDVVVSGSQKGWMVPPGMVFVSMSPEAWKFQAAAKMPRVYWDFTRAKKSLEAWETPWTPAVSIVYALQVAANMLLKEGMPNVYARHAAVGKAARDGVKKLGLKLVAENEKYASNTVTAVRAAQEGLDYDKMRKIIRDENQIVLAGGQGALDHKIFRIGHLGLVNVNDINECIAAIKAALPKIGFTG